MTAYDDTIRGPVPTPDEYWDILNRTSQQELKVKRLHPDAVIPKYATAGSACFDLHSLYDGYLDGIGHTSEIFDTGLAFEIPDGHVMLVFSRSGHAFKNDVRLANSVGVVDQDFRGSVKVKLAADPAALLKVNAGDRIAQAMLVPIPRVRVVEVDELTETARGKGGFGSTGN